MDPEKLAKVLAMAESEHQGEALSALRAARIILARGGMTFRDLALAARTGHADPKPPALPPVPPPPPVREPPPDQLISGLRRQMRDLELQVTALKRQLEKAGGDLERQREETDRWRGLARETADKLWDVGQALERKHNRHNHKEKRRAILDLLMDPASALLADHEIARRIGTSASVVAHCRRRLAIVGRKMRLLPVVLRGRGLLGGSSKRAGALENRRHRWLGHASITIADPGSGRSGPGARGKASTTDPLIPPRGPGQGTKR